MCIPTFACSLCLLSDAHVLYGRSLSLSCVALCATSLAGVRKTFLLRRCSYGAQTCDHAQWRLASRLNAPTGELGGKRGPAEI